MRIDSIRKTALIFHHDRAREHLIHRSRDACGARHYLFMGDGKRRLRARITAEQVIIFKELPRLPSLKSFLP